MVERPSIDGYWAVDPFSTLLNDKNSVLAILAYMVGDIDLDEAQITLLNTIF